MIVYKCIKGFTDRGGDRARIGQEFVMREINYTGDTILDRKSGRGSYIVIPTAQFDDYFQEVKKELKTSPNEFKVGDEVMLSSKSEFYGRSDNNPKDTKGTVTRSYKGFCYQVRWSNGDTNGYTKDCLVAYKEPKKEVITPKREKLVDDMLPIGTKVEVLVNRPDSADLKKGAIVEIMAYSDPCSYILEGHWYVNKKYVKRAPKPAKLPIGSKVRVLVDNPNNSQMMKGELGIIESIYNDTRDYTSYTVKASKDGKYWAIKQEFLEVVKEEEKSKFKFKVGDRVKIAKTSEFYDASDNNPANVEGTVTETGRIGRIAWASLDLEVKWDNGEENNYNPEDLILAENRGPEYFTFTEGFNDIL